MGEVKAIRHKDADTRWNKVATTHRGRPNWGKKAVIAQITGAVARAMLVVMLVATPSLLVTGMSSDAVQIVALVGLLAAALVLFEYTATYPGLLEFRDAPPFNRIRFFAMFITVFLLSYMARADIDPSVASRFLASIALLIGQILDFPYSPVRLFTLMLPAGDGIVSQADIRASAGLAYFISIVSVALFSIILRSKRWPVSNGSFNVWVNLPTFDPTSGGDVIERMQGLARIDVALGVLVPFLLPATVTILTLYFDGLTLENPQTLIWMVSAWAILPASLIMRGIALWRIAKLIGEQRRRAVPGYEEAFQPA